MAIITNADVAAKVRGAAAEKRVSQSDLAGVLKVSRMAVSRRFSGDTPFTPEELSRIGEALQVPVATFFGERAA